MILASLNLSKPASARSAQTANIMIVDRHFLLFVESAWKKQAHHMALSYIKQNDDKALKPIWTKKVYAMMRMTITTHFNPLSEQALTQSKVLNCLSQRRLKMPLVFWINFIGVRQFVPSWTR